MQRLGVEKNALRWDQEQKNISQWLQALPKPVGVMACNDVRGQQVINACAVAEIYVPETVAVIGVDNDQLLCDFCSPPLTSVEPDPQQIGYRAAETLDRLMQGQPAQQRVELIPPVGIVVRQSTDAIGVQDPTVVAAIAFLREAAYSGVTVDQIAGHVSVSRSTLERLFRQSIGHSPQQEIRRTQLQRIQTLLRETDLPLTAIAPLAGFAHTEYMTVFFKRLVGVAPSAYRESIRSRGQ